MHDRGGGLDILVFATFLYELIMYALEDNDAEERIFAV